MTLLGNFIGYKCGICKSSKCPYWKKYTRWIDRHFKKYHPNDQIKLIKRYKQ